VRNIARMKEQFRRWGILYDWDKELASCYPEYYRWNQWFFNRMLEKGLAYRGHSPVNWCPSCQTVLANEQVKDGACERCQTPVQQRELEQWFFRITAYADRLLEGLDRLPSWSDKVKTMQRNWISRSEGCDVTFALEGTGEPITVFTTRVDTIYGATFMAIAPEHPLAERAKTTAPDADYASFLDHLRNQSRLQRESEGGDKEGRFTGLFAINLFNGERLPIWVANFVLVEYGTGAIMSVPAHDERDFAFATRFGIPIRVVIAGPGMDEHTVLTEAYPAEGTVVGSGPFNGLSSTESKSKMGQFAEEHGFGKRIVRYRLRDWLISRQRYWGTPIPVVYCDKDGIVAVPDAELPVLLPTDIAFGSGEGNPLGRSASFVQATCPKCGGPARRETDTMDTFVDSSWYFLRFINPHDHTRMFDTERVKKWMPVDLYIGGIEHAILHLMYARFFYKVLYDWGMVPNDEPFSVLFNQGMITYHSEKTGKVEKMSKSRLNVVAPDELIARFGADTERVYTLFMGPPEKEVEWSEEGVAGGFRFLQRVWAFQDAVAEAAGREGEAGATEKVRVARNRAVKKVTDDLARYRPNTAIAALMELANAMTEQAAAASGAELSEAYETLVKLLHPIAPHITEELWRTLGHKESLLRSGWPTYDAELLGRQQVTVAVQVNGKLRTTIAVEPGQDAATVTAAAREAATKWLEGKELVKTIHVPDRMVSFVVKG
jgi:leucyl-tRNA synthetase